MRRRMRWCGCGSRCGCRSRCECRSRCGGCGCRRACWGLGGGVLGVGDQQHLRGQVGGVDGWHHFQGHARTRDADGAHRVQRKAADNLAGIDAVGVGLVRQFGHRHGGNGEERLVRAQVSGMARHNQKQKKRRKKEKNTTTTTTWRCRNRAHQFATKFSSHTRNTAAPPLMLMMDGRNVHLKRRKPGQELIELLGCGSNAKGVFNARKLRCEELAEGLGLNENAEQLVGQPKRAGGLTQQRQQVGQREHTDGQAVRACPRTT